MPSTPTTPRTINADVFHRARREGAPLHLAAYVARPAVLDLTWLDHYQSDETWANFDLDGRKFRASYVDPRATEGTCVGCAELVDAYQRRDEGIAWMTPDEYDRTDHRALTVTLLDEDDEPTGHEASLWGVCGRTDTLVDQLADERYLAETVAELASEALASEANDAEIQRVAAERRRTERKAAHDARVVELVPAAKQVFGEDARAIILADVWATMEEGTAIDADALRRAKVAATYFALLAVMGIATMPTPATHDLTMETADRLTP